MTELQGHEDRLEISADSSVVVRSREEGSHGRSRVGGSAPSLCQRARCYQSRPWDLRGCRAAQVGAAASAMQRTERSAVRRFGMTAPTPLPDRVGARVRRWAGPLSYRSPPGLPLGLISRPMISAPRLARNAVLVSRGLARRAEP